MPDGNEQRKWIARGKDSKLNIRRLGIGKTTKLAEKTLPERERKRERVGRGRGELHKRR